QRIFEPFFTTKEVGKGSGLGLASEYGIIKQHEGWINVGSSPGEGTTFRIYLPVNRTPKTERVSANETKGDVRGGTERILVVEDEPNLRELICRVLAGAGYAVSEADSGPEAIKLFENSP